MLGQVPSRTAGAGVPHLTWSQWVAVILPAHRDHHRHRRRGAAAGALLRRQVRLPHLPEPGPAAFGAANIASGLSSGFTIGSSTSRAAAMDQAGSRTQLPLLVMAAGALALLLFGAGLLADIPSPAIGAIVGVSVAKLIGTARVPPPVAAVPLRIPHRRNVFPRRTADRTTGRHRAGLRAVADQPVAQGRPSRGRRARGFGRPACVADRRPTTTSTRPSRV